MSRLDDLYQLHRLLDGRRSAISRQTLLDEGELAVRRVLDPKVPNASTPSGPIPGPAAVMSDGDDSDQVAL